jgi:UDP-N-acetylmuramoyl-L-alanyl-D-glutamate--2,6-diaminopimelate ligase
MPTLAELLEGIVERELPERFRARQVTGICEDSRELAPGMVFVARRGTRSDGREHVADALRRGAVAVLGEELGADDSADALILPTPDVCAALARLALRWHGLDRRPLPELIGVTGTNGKSTTAHMLREIIRRADRRCGMLGTVEHDLCSYCEAATMTTPPPLELARLLRACVQAGAAYVVMEVSSHALDQRRTEGLSFAAGVFTNLTQDHLDYHESLGAYREAKARLFRELPAESVAVVNADDPAHEALVAGAGARVVRYGLARGADVSAVIRGSDLSGTRVRARLGGARFDFSTPLVGRHNVYNALAAAATAHALGFPRETIRAGLAGLERVRGRLERVSGMLGFQVFVDYAHTPDALRNAVAALRPLTAARLIVVFGCGGDRDRGKRPLMAQAAAEQADAVVLTSDNPRTEDARRIIDDALAGLADRRKVVVEPDRAEAIRAALACAREGDIVLIAGKGHEDYQIIGTEKRPFDDMQVAIRAARELGRRGTERVA